MADKDMMQALARIEAQNALILTRLDKLAAAGLWSGTGGGGPVRVELLNQLTTKQHAALQMLMQGAANEDVADRFGVSINTAKVYMRSIYKKFGVNTRTQAVLKVRDEFNRIPPETYESLSGGLPKDWAENYKRSDPYKKLYYGG